MNEAVNPLSIDPNERVTPSGHGHHLNGDSHDSLGVTDIGVIPPPPMFSSPSPPPPLPPPPGSQGGLMRGHDHQDQHFAKGKTTVTVFWRVSDPDLYCIHIR